MANSAPREIHREEIEVDGGSEITLSLDVPARGVVHKLVVVQTEGSAAAFVVDLFNSWRPSPPDDAASSESSASASGSSAPEELYRVIPQQSAASGAAVAYYNDSGMPYTNVDHSKSSDLQPKLYLRIRPAGAGAMKFAAAYMGIGQSW